MFDAVKVALDPSPAQEKLLASHAGGARFAYNAMLARVKAAFDAGESIDQSFYALRKQWNMDKDALAVGEDGVIWWAENSKEPTVTGWNLWRRACLTGRKAERATGRAVRSGSQSSRPRASPRPGLRTLLAGLA